MHTFCGQYGMVLRRYERDGDPCAPRSADSAPRVSSRQIRTAAAGAHAFLSVATTVVGLGTLYTVTRGTKSVHSRQAVEAPPGRNDGRSRRCATSAESSSRPARRCSLSVGDIEGATMPLERCEGVGKGSQGVFEAPIKSGASGSAAPKVALDARNPTSAKPPGWESRSRRG